MSNNAAAELFGRPQWVRPSPEMQARLNALIVTDRRDELGSSPSVSEDSGLAYCGRPRNPKPRRRAELSRFDAYNTWQGGR